MSDMAGDDASDRPAPGDETGRSGTINEAGTPGFAVDGTDSFAVPGPADGLPPLDAPAAGAPWRRLLVTVGAAVIVLALVVVIGTSGRDHSDAGSMRGAETTVPEFTLPSPFGGEGDETATTVDDSFDETYSTLATYDPYGTDFTYTTDTTFPYEDDESFDSPPLEIPTYRPYVPPARNVPSVTRPRVTIPARRSVTTTTRPAATTTVATTAAPTTAAPTTAAPTTAAPTTPPPPPVWQQPATDLGVTCPGAVRVWSGQRSMLAGVGANSWRSVDGGRTWTPATADGAPTAYADDANGAGWIGTAVGVFPVGSTSEVGNLSDVTSLSAFTASGTTTLLAVSGGTLQRRVGAADWQQVPLPANTTPGEVLAIDATQFLVGTTGGVLRSADGTAPAKVEDSPGVIGSPLRQGTTVWWLRADRSGVAQGIQDGLHWDTTSGSGIAPAATSLASVPLVGLVTSGAGGGLVASTDGGTTWGPVAAQPPYVPDGIARDGASPATVVWSADCARGRDAILRDEDG